MSCFGLLDLYGPFWPLHFLLVYGVHFWLSLSLKHIIISGSRSERELWERSIY